MHEVLEADLPWFHTMALLSRDHLIEASNHRPAGLDYRDGSYRTCAIKVLERHGQTGATIEWRDSTACCYGEQIWRRCIARRRGICALSGHVIAAGDAVYRPRLAKPPPRNIEAMILASVMETIPFDGVA
jgi:Domain of unknown function (DUF3331)